MAYINLQSPFREILECITEIIIYRLSITSVNFVI